MVVSYLYTCTVIEKVALVIPIIYFIYWLSRKKRCYCCYQQTCTEHCTKLLLTSFIFNRYLIMCWLLLDINSFSSVFLVQLTVFLSQIFITLIVTVVGYYRVIGQEAKRHDVVLGPTTSNYIRYSSLSLFILLKNYRWKYCWEYNYM